MHKQETDRMNTMRRGGSVFVCKFNKQFNSEMEVKHFPFFFAAVATTAEKCPKICAFCRARGNICHAKPWVTLFKRFSLFFIFPTIVGVAGAAAARKAAEAYECGLHLKWCHLPWSLQSCSVVLAPNLIYTHIFVLELWHCGVAMEVRQIAFHRRNGRMPLASSLTTPQLHTHGVWRAYTVLCYTFRFIYFFRLFFCVFLRSKKSAKQSTARISISPVLCVCFVPDFLLSFHPNAFCHIFGSAHYSASKWRQPICVRWIVQRVCLVA